MGALKKAVKALAPGVKRMMRAVRGYSVLDTIQVHCATERIGSHYGGWSICPALIDRESIIYSFGVGEDLSFDLGLIEKYDLQVYAFDPTPKSISWVKAQTLPPNIHFFDYGIASFDGTALFYPPENAEHVSHSMLRRAHNTGNAIEVRVRRLSSIMQELGHSHLSILKMDIEGAEYGVIEDMVDSVIRPYQVLVEFHHRFESVGAGKTVSAVRYLIREGYRIFSISQSHEEYSFILRNP